MPKATPSHSIPVPHSYAETSVNPEVLMVDAEVDLLANRALLLRASGYRVTTTASHLDLLKLGGNTRFSLVLLSDTLGNRVLRAVAECVRHQWPSARILIVGNAQSMLEDHLYDDAVDYRLQPKELLETLVKLSKDSRNQNPKLPYLNADGFGSRGFSSVGLSSHRTVPSESDRAKAAPYERKQAQNLRDTPTDVHHRWRVA